MSAWLSSDPGAAYYAHDPLRQLSLEECQALLERHRVGRLAVREAEGVYLVPISYAFVHGAVYAHAPPGRKVTLMRRWPHVAFQVDEIDSLTQWRSVLVKGKFEEIVDDDEKEAARLVLIAAFGGNLALLTAGQGRRVALSDAILFRIQPEEITGRAQGF